ncbi:MAG: hypothetical protein IPO31_25280 [Candidatus Obscuribacter sp.]|nr:hypothetical protein [Candidatus Obscuribacter sp.]
MTELNPGGSVIAEVLSSSIVAFSAEAVKQAKKPSFGSFVRVESSENNLAIYAVVLDVVTNPPDAVHRPAALGLTRERLKAEQPHIFALLKTEIKACIIGYSQNSNVYLHLPPQPPDVHDFVYGATNDQVIALTGDFDFLRLLIATPSSIPPDELIAAAVREAAKARSSKVESDAYLLQAGRALSQLLRSDYERMISVVRKIKPLEI